VNAAVTRSVSTSSTTDALRADVCRDSDNRPAVRSALQIGRVLVISLVHLFGMSLPVYAQDPMTSVLAELPFPARVESILDRGEIEGYPVSIVRLHLSIPPNLAMERIRQQWSGDVSVGPPVQSRSGPWIVLAVKRATHFRTMQLRGRPEGGSEALLSLWSDPQQWRRPKVHGFDPAVLLSADVRVLRNLNSRDQGKSNRTLVAISPGSPRWVAESLESRVLSHGFEREALALEQSSFRIARLYRSMTGQLGITVHPSGGRSAIVIHYSESEQ
jgi:hypothetical protein